VSAIFPNEANGNMDLEEYANSFPSMGGTKIGSFLRDCIAKAPSGMAAVELGAWLGAGTAQMALASRERGEGDHIEIYCYDRFEANEAEVGKAEKRGLSIEVGQDTLPFVRERLQRFGVPIYFNKCEIIDAKYAGPEIALHVDDATKGFMPFTKSLVEFAPHWVAGTTVVVLMDYGLWKKSKQRKHRELQFMIESNSDCFERIYEAWPGSTVSFRYLGGLDFVRLQEFFLLLKIEDSLKNIEKRQDQLLRESSSFSTKYPIKISNISKLLRKIFR